MCPPTGKRSVLTTAHAAEGSMMGTDQAPAVGWTDICFRDDSDATPGLLPCPPSLKLRCRWVSLAPFLTRDLETTTGNLRQEAKKRGTGEWG